MELSKEGLAVFDTNDILREHLSAKLKSICTSDELREKVLVQIIEGLSNDEIVNLLKTDDILIRTVGNCHAFLSEKEDFSEKLYVKVSVHEPNLAEKITGMILELDLNTLCAILNSEILLKQAIEKCKTSYFSHLQEAEYKENLGHKVYDISCKKYGKEISSHLTGMLLELDTFQLERLIINLEELEEKLKLCYETYKTHFIN